MSGPRATGRQEIASGDAIEVDEKTIRNDIAELTDVGKLNRPERSLGLDGKVRPTRRPQVLARDDREQARALLAIRDGRLYRSEHDTFEDYCRERWNLSRPRAYQLIDAASVVSTIVDTGLPAPANEGQVRELARVPEADRAEVWRETLDRGAAFAERMESRTPGRG